MAKLHRWQSLNDPICSRHICRSAPAGTENMNVLQEQNFPFTLQSAEIYGSKKSRNVYDTLYNLYKNQGLTDDEIDKILVLDIKERDYFTSRNAPNEHGGGGLFAEDDTIMSWLFGEH